MDAVFDVLTREIALVQGPPGTGKVSGEEGPANETQTFTGVELLRLLFANDIG